MRVKCQRDGELPDGRRGEISAVHLPHPAVTDIGCIVICFLFVQYRIMLLKRRFFILENSKRQSMNSFKSELTCSVFSFEYWREARREFANPRTLVFAALIVALRVIIKMAKIPLAAGLSLSFDCYVNALGSVVYGPIVAILVGAISDTLGCILFPTGPYFFPFMFVEISSSVIFALFLWRRKIKVGRVLITKFTVNLFCNIFLTSLFMKWMYIALGDPKAATYNIINGVRIAKNLVLFPVESILIVIVLGAFIPVLKKLKAVPESQGELIIQKKHVIAVAIITVASVGLILLYSFFLKDFISSLNIKFF